MMCTVGHAQTYVRLMFESDEEFGSRVRSKIDTAIILLLDTMFFASLAAH